MHRTLSVVLPLFLPLAVAASAALPSIADDTSRETTNATAQEMLQAGDHSRKLTVGDFERSYSVHVPKNYDEQRPLPVVLALHGAAMNGSMMAWFSGLNKKSDEAGFLVVYPDGTGTGPFLTWNAGGLRGRMAEGRPNDVEFISKLLDDLASVAKIDAQRVYACGMSNGGMMCYRLAAELSDRVAAIAPVAGTIAIEEHKPTRAVPVIHFHGTKDNIVPFEAAKGTAASFMRIKGVEDSVQTWVKLNACQTPPRTDVLSKDGDSMKVTRTTYDQGRNGAEVVLVLIEGGGHTWPGQQPPVGF
ncbi:MAG: hypothetical protein RIS70_2724, partial [Planctomycetota bacterium]